MAAVLVVDDETMMRSVLRRYLEKRGHVVFEAEDGVAALDVLARQPVDLAIVDLVMPRKDGFTLVREMENEFPDTEVIVISGVSDQLEKAIKQLNVVATLGKPFDLAELDVAVGKAVSG